MFGDAGVDSICIETLEKLPQNVKHLSGVRFFTAFQCRWYMCRYLGERPLNKQVSQWPISFHSISKPLIFASFYRRRAPQKPGISSGRHHSIVCQCRWYLHRFLGERPFQNQASQWPRSFHSVSRSMICAPVSRRSSIPKAAISAAQVKS